MYRIRLHYSHEDWAYHRRCVALQKYAPDDFEVDIAQWHPGLRREPLPAESYDLILNLVPDHLALRATLQAAGHDRSLIVGGLNVGWGHHAERLEMCRDADHIVVNNRDLWERLDRPGKRTEWCSHGGNYHTPPMTWISNGVDLDVFRVTQPVADRTPRVLWAGCEYHCSRTNIKGWGEVLVPLQKMLTKARVAHDFRRTDAGDSSSRRTTQEMVDWYNTGTVYVCASSSEGTPNPALEAAACGCVVVSTRVGNMPELIRPYHNGEFVDRETQEMFDAIMRCNRRYSEMAIVMRARLLLTGFAWTDRAPRYYDLFRELINAQNQAAV